MFFRPHGQLKGLNINVGLKLLHPLLQCPEQPQHVVRTHNCNAVQGVIKDYATSVK